MTLFASAAATLALITLSAAFGYEPSDLSFVDSGNEVASSIDHLPAELTPARVEADDLGPGVLQLESIGQFVSPVEVIAGAGDSRTFVVQQAGQLVAEDGTVALDISDRVLADGERGLLGAAFHPDEPLLYVHYSNLDGDTVVAEYPFDASTGVADSDLHRQVLLIAQPYENHNGGELVFGPDNLLYLGLGDGGLADDPVRSALDLASPLGKILRIDPTLSDDGAYAVPDDNPFVDQSGADPTVWSYGLRNPWKFSFDSATGDLWIADVGQNDWEEINYVRAIDGVGAGRGVSFGWSAFEGDARFNTDQSAEGHTAPLVTYERADGQCSISGGAVYRGNDLPQLDGWFVYGDYCTGTIWGFDSTADPGDREIVALAQTEALAAIATGGDGELFAVSIAGTVSRLTSV